MGHAYASNLVHCVFSTKNRQPLILPDVRERLWAYMIGIGTNKELPILAVGGIADHIHALIALHPTMPLSKAIQTLKANSSKWMSEHQAGFAWQEGYGAFSVSPSNVPVVKRYIREQEAHHRRRTFEQEFLLLLKKSGIEYDPKYVLG